jgi:predicted DNA-binding ribbon-helix-helix protein
MKSPIVKRSVVIRGHKTSISLEDQFWTEMKAIAAEQKLTLSELVSLVDSERSETSNLSSALRCFVLARSPAVSSPQTTPWYRRRSAGPLLRLRGATA